ncbi:MAG: GNAT family N-acetyltransferase [Caldilineaceae bacterium]
MIRALTDTDRTQAVDFLAQAPQFNLYMLGNIEKLGFSHEFCEFWGDFANDGAGAPLRGVLNRYMTGWTVYGEQAADWPALGAIVDAHAIQAERLQDNPGGVASFLPYLQCYTSHHHETEEVMVLEPSQFQPASAPADVIVRRGRLTDLPQLIPFYADAEHMTRSAAAIERPLRDTRLWLAEESGQILSTALTNAETATLAMIGGVYTPPAARGRRLSQAVCSALCADLIRDGKQPVLYWSTPAAGAVYRKLGFQACGQWRSVWLQPSA